MGLREERQEKVQALFAPATERRCRIKETLAREAAEDLGVELRSVEFSWPDGAGSCSYALAEGTPAAERDLFAERINTVLGNTALLILRDGSRPE